MADLRGSPRAVACVAIGDQRVEVDAFSGRVTAHSRALGLSPADAAAVEHVLRIAAALDLSPLVVGAGPAGLDPVLRDLAGLGVEVARVAWPPTHEHDLLGELAADEAELAAALAAAIRSYGSPRLVVCGDRSATRGTGALPSFLSHELGAAQALGLVSLQAMPADGLVGERRLEGGRREVLRIPLPAVCSVEGAGVRLRRAALPGALVAARMAVPVFTPPAPGQARVRVLASRPFVPRPRVAPAPTGSVRERLLSLTGALSEREPPTVVGPMGADEAAGLLLAYLDRRGFAPPTRRAEGERS